MCGGGAFVLTEWDLWLWQRLGRAEWKIFWISWILVCTSLTDSFVRGSVARVGCATYAVTTCGCTNHSHSHLTSVIQQIFSLSDFCNIRSEFRRLHHQDQDSGIRRQKEKRRVKKSLNRSHYFLIDNFVEFDFLFIILTSEDKFKSFESLVTSAICHYSSDSDLGQS